MPREVYLGETIYLYTTIYDTDGVTPLSGEDYSNFSAVLIINGTVTSLSLTPLNFDEAGSSGTYFLIFTPTVVGDYLIRLKGANDQKEAWVTETFTVKAATEGLAIVERSLTNRLTIELGGDGHYYQRLYNDAGTAILMQWRLYDKDGNDIVLTGRGPAARGTPTTP